MTFFKPELVIRPRYALDQHPQHGADVSYATELVYVPLEDAKLERLLEASEATGLTIEEIVQAAVSEVSPREARKLANDCVREVRTIKHSTFLL
jgi:glycerol dehydrogenase-like iron-containing ADH family enzyme